MGLVGSLKRTKGWTWCVSALTAAIAFAAAVHAQSATAPSAPQIAAQVQAFYDQTKSIRADFYQTYFHRVYNRYDRSKGSVQFEKPGKMRWDYAKPNGKIIVSNGKQLLVYEPEWRPWAVHAGLYGLSANVTLLCLLSWWYQPPDDAQAFLQVARDG